MTDVSPGRDRHPSQTDNATGYFLTTTGMDWFRTQYLPEGEDGSDPYASPFMADDVSGLPPAFVVTAEYDPLRDEGEAYGAKLAAAGVPVETLRAEGMFHGFFGMGELIRIRQADHRAGVRRRAHGPGRLTPGTGRAHRPGRLGWRSATRAPARRRSGAGRPPERYADARRRLDHVGLDRHPDGDDVDLAAGDVAHHHRALIELDHGDHVGQLVAEGLGPLLADDGEGVHGAPPGRLFPLRVAPARRADRPRVELALPARRAALDDQTAFGRFRPVVGRHRIPGGQGTLPRLAAVAPRVGSRMLPSEDGGADAGQPTARTDRRRHLAIGHLGLAGLVTELAGRLDQQEDAAHAGVAGRQPPAVGVEGKVTASAQVTLGHVGPALAHARRSRGLRAGAGR